MRTHIGVDEVVLGVGVGLLSVGLALAWMPGAFLVPGAVLVWIALPSRQPLVTRAQAPAAAKTRRRTE